MQTTRFDAQVRARADTAVIDLQGEISGPADAALTAAYDGAAAQTPSAILLNFAHVEYINSTGIALIVGLLARARKDGIEIRSSGLTDHYRQIFEITRLADFMGMFPDEDTALGAAGGVDGSREATRGGQE